MKTHKEGNVAFQATTLGDATLFTAAISMHGKGSSGLEPSELLFNHQ